jgi:hypothetical protein
MVNGSLEAQAQLFMTSNPIGSNNERIKTWLLEGEASQHPDDSKNSNDPNANHGTHQHSWWKVVCLTGVDYFSTLGYQPGIAALAAGVLSPIATLVLVLVTLFGALPVYSRVAAESPHGNGSISMLERLLGFWPGKLFVLALLGFAATDFIITITLSAADAAAHVIENPYFVQVFHTHESEGAQIGITLGLIALLGAVFLKGFKEAIGIAVVLVVAYLGLNIIVIGRGIIEVIHQPLEFHNWLTALNSRSSNPLLIVGFALLLFPKLALGLSGFETGVAVMPLVKGKPGDNPRQPAARIRNTRRMLTAAAVIMSFFLIASSFVTTLHIPAAAFQEGGEANGRALAYLAHQFFGDAFGTVYDISTVLILWFAGASAMAALLNLVPRYLPRYGMAPEWARAVRPLTLLFTLIAFLVTLVFRADVDAQGGAYATGVLVLMSSAAIAVYLSARAQKQRAAMIGFAIITLVFIYTTVVNVIERPDGLRIALVFIAAIVFFSILSRVLRSTELRIGKVTLDPLALEFIRIATHGSGELHIIANKRQAGDWGEYQDKELAEREDHHIDQLEPVLFFEVEVEDASEFAGELLVQGVEVSSPNGQTYRVLRATASSVSNAIAALLFELRDQTGTIPHCYFTWTENQPLANVARFLFLGEGDTAPVTREIIRQHETQPRRRPRIHVG